jgi:hypothetical protein
LVYNDSIEKDKKMTTKNWTCEIWWQNRDGDEVTTCETFDSKDEAEKYGKSRMGTFSPRGRMGAYYEVYEKATARNWATA